MKGRANGQPKLTETAVKELHDRMFAAHAEYPLAELVAESGMSSRPSCPDARSLPVSPSTPRFSIVEVTRQAAGGGPA